MSETTLKAYIQTDSHKVLRSENPYSYTDPDTGRESHVNYYTMWDYAEERSSYDHWDADSIKFLYDSRTDFVLVLESCESDGDANDGDAIRAMEGAPNPYNKVIGLNGIWVSFIRKHIDDPPTRKQIENWGWGSETIGLLEFLELEITRGDGQKAKAIGWLGNMEYFFWRFSNKNTKDVARRIKNIKLIRTRIEAIKGVADAGRDVSAFLELTDWGKLEKYEERILEKMDAFVKAGIVYEKRFFQKFVVNSEGKRFPQNRSFYFPTPDRAPADDRTGYTIYTWLDWQNRAERIGQLVLVGHPDKITAPALNYRMWKSGAPLTKDGKEDVAMRAIEVYGMVDDDPSRETLVDTTEERYLAGSDKIPTVNSDGTYDFPIQPNTYFAYAMYASGVLNRRLKNDAGISGRTADTLDVYYRSSLIEMKDWDVWPAYTEFYGALMLDAHIKTYSTGRVKELINNSWERYKDVIVKQKTGLLGATLGKDQDELTIYEQFTTVIAEALAFQFLTHGHTLETAYYFLSLPRESDEDPPSADDLKKIQENAADADRRAFDAAAGSEAGEVELSEKDIRERQLFLKQCALLMNMDNLKEAYRREFPKLPSGERISYNNEIWTLDVDNTDDRSQMVNRLISPTAESVDAFLKSTPDIQAALAPKIRFFKVYNDAKNGNNLREVEIAFPRHYDPDNSKYLLRDDGEIFRGGGSGIKDFSWSFEGTTPATARNDIKASLTLYFQDFSELFRMRSGDDLFGAGQGKKEKFSYIDLLLLPGTTIKPKNEKEEDSSLKPHILDYDPANYRIRVDVGWTIRDDQQFSRIAKDRGEGEFIVTKGDNKRNLITEALRKINKSYYLNMVEHVMDFKDDGSVEIKVDYRAYLESAGKTTNLDALTTLALTRQKKAITEEYRTILAKEICADNRRRFEQLIATYNALELEILKKSHQSIVERLVKNKKLHYCFIDDEAVRGFAKLGFFVSRPTLGMPNKLKAESKNVASAIEKKVTENEEGEKETKDKFLDANMKGLLSGPQANQQVVTFFYVGDLIHTVMDCMIDPENGKRYANLQNTKILLSSFNYRDAQNRLRDVNISEIPISTEYFFEWMNQNVIKPKRRSYPITYFIRDICNKLIVDLMLEVCINRTPVKTIRFNTMSLLAMGIPQNTGGNEYWTDPFNNMPKISGTSHINATEAYDDGMLPLKSNLSDQNIKGMYNYFLIYPVTHIQEHRGEGDLFDDGDKGIYHFAVGQNKGILKRMKFDKTDIQYIREARFMNHGHDGLMQLSAVYKVTMEMFGNTLFYPGMQVFIDPRHMGGHDYDPTVPGSIANSLGFGGYHLITRVQSSIGPGKFNTTVEAQFVYSGDQHPGPYNNSNKGSMTDSDSLNKKVDEYRTATTFTDDSCSMIAHIRLQTLDQIDQAPVDLTDLSEPDLKVAAQLGYSLNTIQENILSGEEE